jgi:hypothetical protein
VLTARLSRDRKNDTLKYYLIMLAERAARPKSDKTIRERFGSSKDVSAIVLADFEQNRKPPRGETWRLSTG